MVEENESPSYLELVQFFLPLALTSGIIGLSHSVVNAGIARTSEPEISLAAYALAKSLMMLFQCPMMMIRQTTASLVHDKKSFVTFYRFSIGLAFSISLFLAIMAFTPIGYWMFTKVLGATHNIAVNAQLAMGVLCIIPFTSVVRNVYQGIAVLTRQTKVVPIGTAMRLVIMGVLAFGLALFTNVPGALVGAIAFIGAFVIEALVIYLILRSSVEDVDVYAVNDGKEQVTFKTISYFFIPLVFTAFLTSTFKPLINAGLARSYSPEIALAAFAVGLELARLMVNPEAMLHLCSLNYTKPNDPESYITVRKFSLGVGMVSSFVLGIISFSPIGMWMLRNLIGVSPEIAEPALGVMRVLVFLPIVKSWYEYIWGLLMKRKTTGRVGIAKAVNLIVLIIVLVTGFYTSSIHPAVIAAIAYVSGAAGEMALVQWWEIKEAGTHRKITAV